MPSSRPKFGTLHANHTFYLATRPKDEKAKHFYTQTTYHCPICAHMRSVFIEIIEGIHLAKKIAQIQGIV
jgi:hypothetical protein